MNAKVIPIWLAAAFLLAGCGPKDADYYAKHLDEANQKVSECMNNPQKMQEDKECTAALTAQTAARINRMKENPQ